MTSQFERDGYIIFPSAIDADTVDKLRSEADRVCAATLIGMRLARTIDPRVTWWRLKDGHPYLLKIKPILNVAPAAAEIATGAWMTSRLGDLLGGAPILMEDKFMYKQRLNDDIDWVDLPVLGEEVCKHTDGAYFTRRGYGRVLTAAICLDECTAAGGALKVWPGSHGRDIQMVPTDNQGPVVPDDQAPDSDAVLLEAAAGSVLVWDSRLVHASDPNISDRPRRLLVFGFTAGGPS
jgi:Phytanoyl-CoA dioxygenase (PhyH)